MIGEVVGDETALDALVGNLIDNACRYTPARDVPRFKRWLGAEASIEEIHVDGGGPPRGEACGARHFHIIRRPAGIGAMGGKDGVKAKGLRCLRPPQRGAVLRAHHQSRRPAPERIGHRKGRGRSG